MEKTEEDQILNQASDEEENVELNVEYGQSSASEEEKVADDIVEKKVKSGKKPRSKAQIEAFERCRKIRMEKAAQRKKDKLAEQYEAYKEAKANKKKVPKRFKDIATSESDVELEDEPEPAKPKKKAKKPVVLSSSSESESEPEIKVKKKSKSKSRTKKVKPIKKKKRIVYESSSSSDSSEEEEVIIRKRRKGKKSVKFQDEEPVVETADYFNIV